MLLCRTELNNSNSLNNSNNSNNSHRLRKQSYHNEVSHSEAYHLNKVEQADCPLLEELKNWMVGN